MTAPSRKMIHYLEEAHASEKCFARKLAKELETAPSGDYQRDLVRNLRETREHEQRLEERLRHMGRGGISIRGLVGGAARGAVALATAPITGARPSAAPEELLATAKDTCATESRHIAIYTAIEQLARRTGDDETAEMAVWIRAHEEEMLLRMRRHVPPLMDAVVASDVDVDANHASAVATVGGDDVIARH